MGAARHTLGILRRAAAALVLGGAVVAQLRLVDPATQREIEEEAPSSWKLVSVPVTGAEFHVPPGFRRLRPKRHYQRASYQGRLGGAQVKLFLNEIPGQFTTTSRVLLALSAESTLLEVFAFRNGDEPAALVKRRTRDPERTILEVAVCPARKGVTLELQYLTDPGPQAMAEGQRLLSFLSVIPRRGLTVAKRSPEVERQAEIELGFDAKVWDKVKVETSQHYHLYTWAPSGKKLLQLLENELIPKLDAFVGRVPARFEGGRLPVFLHRTVQEYQLAAMKQGIPKEHVEAMHGYAWDRYYSTYYSGPRAPIHLHEGTHQYVTAVLGLDGGGPWLQEGIAQHVEADFARRDPVRFARNLLKRDRAAFPRLRDLLAAKTFLDTRGKLAPAERYDVAAAFIRYLAREQHNHFRHLLLQAGVLPPGQPKLIEEAFRRSIRMDLAALDHAFRGWLLAER